MTLDLPIAIQGHPVHWQLHLGADGFSATLVFLTCLVSLAVLLTSQSQIQSKHETYAGLILITQGLLVGVFLAMDLLLFYVFFEAVLIPIVILINLWGDAKESMRASRKFLLYTLAGSIRWWWALWGLFSNRQTRTGHRQYRSANYRSYPMPHRFKTSQHLLRQVTTKPLGKN